MGKGKYYVVWKGRKSGIYDNWDDCREQIFGFEGAAYKSFKTKEEADEGFKSSQKKNTRFNSVSNEITSVSSGPIIESIAVDGAGNNISGLVEYRGVYTRTKEVLFSRGPFEGGTNNLVEFLALVHALAYCKERNIKLPIYSDSKTAIAWVRQKKIKTVAVKDETNNKIFEYIDGAIKWLENNAYSNKILKWETHLWGEIPADYGRK